MEDAPETMELLGKTVEELAPGIFILFLFLLNFFYRRLSGVGHFLTIRFLKQFLIVLMRNWIDDYPKTSEMEAKTLYTSFLNSPYKYFHGIRFLQHAKKPVPWSYFT
jgi:hypothetical protein